MRWALTRPDAPGQTEKKTQPMEGRSAIFLNFFLLKHCCSHSISNLTPPPSRVASTTSEEKYISCLCGRVSHCLLLWTSVDFFHYIALSVYLPALPSVWASHSLHVYQGVISFPWCPVWWQGRWQLAGNWSLVPVSHYQILCVVYTYINTQFSCQFFIGRGGCLLL